LKAKRERRAIQTALPGPIRGIKPAAETTTLPAVRRGKNSLNIEKNSSNVDIWIFLKIREKISAVILPENFHGQFCNFLMHSYLFEWKL
jgi:hypothetical protein